MILLGHDTCIGDYELLMYITSGYTGLKEAIYTRGQALYIGLRYVILYCNKTPSVGQCIHNDGCLWSIDSNVEVMFTMSFSYLGI